MAFRLWGEDVTTGVVSSFIGGKVRLHGIGPETAHEYREILHRLISFAMKVAGVRMPGDSRRNPVAVVKRYRVQSPKIRFLSLNEIDAQLTVLEPWPLIKGTWQSSLPPPPPPRESRRVTSGFKTCASTTGAETVRIVRDAVGVAVCRQE